MSEYQYYEFRATDRALTEKKQGILRGYSGRAAISRTRFVNSYSYGNFRGNESEWMEKYFDAFLYMANWGMHRLMLRLPTSLLSLEAVKRYSAGDLFSARVEHPSAACGVILAVVQSCLLKTLLYGVSPDNRGARCGGSAGGLSARPQGEHCRPGKCVAAGVTSSRTVLLRWLHKETRK